MMYCARVCGTGCNIIIIIQLADQLMRGVIIIR